jgi:hypothetical protein
MSRFGCSTAACLMDQMQELSPECVLMLVPQPTDSASRAPEPAADLQSAYDEEYGWAPVSLLGGDSFSSLVASLFQASGAAFAAPSQMITIDSFPLIFDEEDSLTGSSEIEYTVDVVDTFDGAEYMISATDNVPADSDPVSFILESLPFELASISRLIHGDVVPAFSDHPCGAEMSSICACAQGPDATMSCLTRNFARLSPRCKCAMHHLLGDSLDDALDEQSKRLAAPELRSVPAMLFSDAVEQDMRMEDQQAAPHGPCFFMPVVALFLLILTVRGIAAFCRSTRHPAMMVVLPSEPAEISKGVRPLLISQLRSEYIDAIPSDAIPVARV